MASANNFDHEGFSFDVSHDNLNTLLDGARMTSRYFEIDELSDIASNVRYEFTALHINIHSLPSKFDQLQNMLDRLTEQKLEVDFILLCETFLTDTNINLYSLPGYNFFSQNRKHKSKGGVAVYTSTKFGARERPDLCINDEGEFESLLVEIFLKNRKSNCLRNLQNS